MTKKYRITHEGRLAGIIYISPHPSYPGHTISTAIPVTREGKWKDNTLTITFERPVHDIHPNGTSDTNIIGDLARQAGIDINAVTISEEPI